MNQSQCHSREEKLLNIAVYLILVAFCFFIGWRYLYVGLDRDEGNWLFKASKLLVGQVLYKDLPHPKPPALFFTLIPLVLICGTSIIKFRIFVLLLTSVTAYFVFLIGKYMNRTREGLVASLLFEYLSLHPQFLGFLLLTENFLNLLTSIIVYLLVVQRQNISYRKLYLISGVLTCYATLIKQTGALSVLLVIIFILTIKEERPYKIKKFGFFFLGNLLTLLPFLFYFIINSAVFDAINQVILLRGRAVGEFASLGARLYKLKYVGSKLYGIFAIFLLHILTLPKFDRKNQIIGFWFLSASIFTQIGPTTYNHHFLTIFPSLAIFTGAGLIRAIEGIQKQIAINKRNLLKEKTNRKIFLLIFVFLILIIPLDIIDQEEGVNFLAYEEQASYKQISGRAYGNTLTYYEEITIVAFLTQNAKADEKIFVFMSEPQIYYLSGIDPMTSETFWGETDFLSLTAEELEKYILQPLKLNQVRFVFLVNDTHLQNVYNADNGLALRDYLDTQYKQTQPIGKVLIFVREE